MNSESVRLLRRLLSGTGWIMCSKFIALPSGLMTSIALTRWLPLRDYGVFSLSSIIVFWTEWTVIACFSQASIKLVGEAEDWRPAAATILRLTLLLAGGVLLLLWLTTVPMAMAMDAPALTWVLWLFALDMLPFCLLQACIRIMIGRGAFARSVWFEAGYWVVRLVLVATFLPLLPVPHVAVLCFLGASLAMLLLIAWTERELLCLFAPGAVQVPLSHLYQFAAPLFLFTLSIRLSMRSDLFALKLLGGSLEQVGMYGAMQNLALVPVTVMSSLSPLLLATLVHSRRATSDPASSCAISQLALRAALWLLPFSLLAAGMSSEIATLIYGPTFAAGGTMLALLSLRSMVLVLFSICMTMLIAADQQRQAGYAAGLLFLLSLGSCGVLIPWYGPEGAALAQLLSAMVVLLVGLWQVYQTWQVVLPWRTLGRSILLGGAIYVLSVGWPAQGMALGGKLLVLGGLTLLGYVALGELQHKDRVLFFDVLQKRSEEVRVS